MTAINWLSLNYTAEYVSTSPFDILNHVLSPPILISPLGGELLSGNITIVWDPAIDSLDKPIYYNLYISSDNRTWMRIAQDVVMSEFIWDSTSVDDGFYYLRIDAYNDYAMLTSEYSSTSFEIFNHNLSEPTIIYPNGGEMISGGITISWVEAIDSEGEIVTYYIYYSADNGETWILLANAPSTTAFLWDTETVNDGSNYLIKVIATSSDSLVAEDISDGTFTIENNIASTNNQTSENTTKETTSQTRSTSETETIEDSTNAGLSFSLWALFIGMMVLNLIVSIIRKR